MKSNVHGEPTDRPRRAPIGTLVATVIAVSVLSLSAAGCSSEGSGASERAPGRGQSEGLSFDPQNLPSAQELANVELPETPAGTICDPAEVEPASDGDGLSAYVGFECEDPPQFDSVDQEAATAMFEKIGALEFVSESAARSAFGPDVIRQDGRTSTDVKPSTRVPSGTICVESTEDGGEPYQRCAFRAGRFIVNATGNEGSASGAEAGLRVLEQWLERASQPAQ